MKKQTLERNTPAVFTHGGWGAYKGRKKNNKLNFPWPKMARLGPPFWPQNPPPKKLCGSLVCILSQEMRHINFLLGGPKRAVLGGGQKVYVEKVDVLFSRTEESPDIPQKFPGDFHSPLPDFARSFPDRQTLLQPQSLYGRMNSIRAQSLYDTIWICVCDLGFSANIPTDLFL